jgi:hypothetical protein
MTQEDAFSPATLSEKDKGLAAGNVDIDSTKDFLSAERLAETADFNEVSLGRTHQ